MKKTKLNVNQVLALSQSAQVLRSFTGAGFTMDLANRVNAIAVKLLPSINILNETRELINERQLSISKLDEGEEKTKAIDQLNSDIISENKKTFEVELPTLKVSDFAGIEIKGEKEVEQQNGSKKKFDYRDAYFDLVNNGIIVD